MSVLLASHFNDEEAAYRFLEERVWPDGPVCPHCGGFERLSKMRGKSTRIGLYKCYECRRPFRVTVGSFFEFSRVPLHVWLRAIYLGCSNTKGFSANHLSLVLGVTPKTAGFMVQRIRKALRSDELVRSKNDGGILDDETFIDRAERPTAAVLSLRVPRTPRSVELAG